MSDATSTYRISNDSLAGFIDGCCLLNPDMYVVGSDLWNEWENWCRSTSQHAGTNRMVRQRWSCEESQSRDRMNICVQGIGLADDED